jgi:hypothetical protein
VVGLEINALIRDRQHPVDLYQWQDPFHLEFALKRKFFGKTLDARLVKFNFGVCPRTRVV